MLVSVIIPCFNAERYISECVDSVLAQSYQEIEIICVDNNSIDSTLSVLKNLEHTHTGKIKIYSEKSKGASFARNKGLAESNGEWIQFLDADDVLLPNKIEHQITLIKNNHFDIVVGSYLYEKNSERSKIEIAKNSWIGLVKGRLGITSSNLWRKEKIVEVGGWDILSSSQESNLMFKLLKANAEVIFDDSFNTIIKNQDQNSISNSSRAQNWLRYIDLRIQIWNYLAQGEKLNFEITKVLKSIVFDSIRALYSCDKIQGVNYYQKHVLGKYIPESSQATSKLYIISYKIVGFVIAEKIFFVFRLMKLKNK